MSLSQKAFEVSWDAVFIFILFFLFLDKSPVSICLYQTLNIEAADMKRGVATHVPGWNRTAYAACGVII